MAVNYPDRAAVDERRLLAQELPDAIAHQLSSVAMHLMASAETTSPSGLRQTLVTIAELNAEALEDVRRLIRVLSETPATAAFGDPIADLAQRLSPTAAAQAARRGLSSAGLDPAVRVPFAADRLGLTVRETLSRLISSCAARMLLHTPTGGACLISVTVGEASTELQAQHPLRGAVAKQPEPALRALEVRLAILGGTLTSTCREGEWRAVAWLPRDV
ncbi:MAG: histidine kinase dimerization/phosphoacceptor domain-containing protein [Micropruina sp.]|nr:histidine kinase dimerization/phosphoacceptor domain-containing protein [Micropruina sp.]